MYICSSAIVLEKVHTVINFVINLYRGFKLICGSDMTPWSSNRNTRTNTCTFCDTLINKGLMFRFSVRFGFDTFLPIFEIKYFDLITAMAKVYGSFTLCCFYHHTFSTMYHYQSNTIIL